MHPAIRKLNVKPVGAIAMLQAWMQRRSSSPRRFDLLWVLAAVLTAAATGAAAQGPQAPWGPDQRNSNELEVRHDALPDELPMDQIEIVVEASDDYCKPKRIKLLGISLPAPVNPTLTLFCHHMETYLRSHAGPLPLRVSRQIWSQRKIADHVAGLDVVPQRRYVLLSRWRAYDADVSQYGVVRQVRWAIEDALWDSAENKLMWHSLRNLISDDQYAEGRFWGLQVNLRGHFSFTLPATLARRGAVRAHAPVPGGHWVASKQIAGWQSASRGAIAFVNSFHSTSNGVRSLGRSKAFLIREIAQTPYLAEKLEWPSDASMRRDNTPQMAVTPRLDYNTHALLDLPPGRYVIDPYDPSRGAPIDIELKAGEIAVVNYSRNLVGPDGPELADIKVWEKTLARSRHAFLEDVRVLPDPLQTECWFIGP